MKRTVKTCQECERFFLVKYNMIIGDFCKICRIKIQRKAEFKLSEYMQIKYNKELIGVN